MPEHPGVFRIDPASFEPFHAEPVYLPGMISPRESGIVLSGTAHYQLERRCCIKWRTKPLIAHSFKFSVKATPRQSIGAYAIGIEEPEGRPSIHVAHVLRSSLCAYQEELKANAYSSWAYDNDGNRTQVRIDGPSRAGKQSLVLTVAYDAEAGHLSCLVNSVPIHTIEAHLDRFQLEISFEALGVSGPFEVIFEDLLYWTLDNHPGRNVQTLSAKRLGRALESKMAESEFAEPIQPERMKAASQTVTWLHLSDLHYGKAEDYPIDIIEENLLADIKGMMEIGLQPDFIVFTGDLAFSGEVDQYSWIEGFLDRLCNVTGLSRKKLFVVPGNHDVNRSLIDPYLAFGVCELLNSQDKVSSFLGPSYNRSHAFDKFSPYRAFFNRYFKDILEIDDGECFWVRRYPVGRRVVGLLGLNSAWMSGFYMNAKGEFDDHGKLILGERQVDQANKRLDELGGADIHIALLHHPFSSLNDDFDAGSVEDLMRQKCDFVLRGHQHRPNAVLEYTPQGRTIIIPAGACYNRGAPWVSGYNFVQLDLSAGKGTVYLRRYSPRSRAWQADLDTTGEALGGQMIFPLGESLCDSVSSGSP